MHQRFSIFLYQFWLHVYFDTVLTRSSYLVVASWWSVGRFFPLSNGAKPMQPASFFFWRITIQYSHCIQNTKGLAVEVMSYSGSGNSIYDLLLSVMIELILFDRINVCFSSCLLFGFLSASVALRSK